MKQMDQQLKERLIGAAVLVTLGMLLIPSFLKGPPRETPVEVGVELPAPDRKGAGSQTIRIKVAEESPEAGSITRPPEPSDPAPSGGAAAKPDESEPVKPEPAPAKAAAEDRPVPEPTPTPAAKPARQAPPAQPTPTGGWAVQLGSFSRKDNADRLAKELSDRGYDVFIDRGEARGKSWYRVRVGPVTDRAEAEALAARLRAGGHSGKVVSNEG